MRKVDITTKINMFEPEITMQGETFDGVQEASYVVLEESKTGGGIGGSTYTVKTGTRSFLDIVVESRNQFTSYIVNRMSSNQSQTIELKISGLDQEGLMRIIEGKFAISTMEGVEIVQIRLLGMAGVKIQ